MSLISARELLARLGDPALRICDVRWWLTDPGKGRRDYDAAHLPGAVFVDAGPRPRGGGGRRPPSPPLPGRLRGAHGADSASATTARSSPTTTRAAPSRRACGGCSTTWVTATSASSTAGSPRGSRSVARSRRRSTPHPRARLTLRDGWTRVIDRDGLVARGCGDRRAHRRPRARALSRRGRAGRRRARPHPDGRQPADAGNLGPDGRFLAPDVLRDAVRRPWAPTS